MLQLQKANRHPQRANRECTGEPRGTFPYFPEIGEILIKQFSGGFRREMGAPKGLPDTIQSIWVAGTPLISNLGTIPKQNHFFQPPFLVPKPSQASPGKSQVQILVPGSKNGSPRPKTKKMRTEKPCRTSVPEFQMEAYGAS